MKQVKRACARIVAAACTALTAFAQGLLAASTVLNWWRFKFLDHVVLPTDTFIATYPRSGTTWMQMLIYQLTTNGSMDFAHISQFVPTFEKMAGATRPLYLEYLSQSPRYFKTHLPFRGPRSIPKGPGKYIYVTRNVQDVAVSLFHFYRTQLRYKGTLAEFFELFVRGRVVYGSWFQHVAEWHSQRNDPRFLFINYEDLKRDLTGCVLQIADFCGIRVEAEQLPRILERCSFEFMKAHGRKFDVVGEQVWEMGRLERDSFIRTGGTGEGETALTSEQKEQLDTLARKWLGNDYDPSRRELIAN